MSINNDELVIDTLKYEVKRNGEIINLTPNEYKLLMTIGLTITKAIIEAHKGGIQVHSNINVGTEFIVTLSKQVG